MRNRTALAAVALAGLLPLAACSGAQEPTPAPTAAETAAPTETATTATATVTESAGPISGVYAFGQAAEYPTSEVPYTVALAPPQPFTPSQTASGNAGPGGALNVAVTIRNQGQAPLSVANLYPSASSGGVAAEPIYDSEQGITSPPSTSVLPGQAVTYSVVFGVADPADLTVQVPGAAFTDQPALFSTSQTITG